LTFRFSPLVEFQQKTSRKVYTKKYAKNITKKICLMVGYD
jgi:hypothetical protein